MIETVYGKIVKVNEDKRLIAIMQHKKLAYFYMSKGMFRQFLDYFHKDIYVFLKVKKETRIYKDFLVQNVVSIDKVLSPRGNQPTVFYDISMIKTEIKKLINQERYRLFIDFEMSMPPYQNYNKFISEIIQVGFVLTDARGKEIQRYNAFVKPKLFPKLSKRTLKFLDLSQDDVDHGTKFEDLYQILYNINQEYQPIIYVWGKNDKSELSKLNRIHDLDDFINDMQFVDLLSLHKTYFRLKNDLGLFNAYNMYAKEDLNQQRHDALEDAMVTKDVFYWFKDVCNHKMKVEI
ncbi:MAG: exonuclease domain-containing protein [Candidatus Izemoplasmatales bacterium]